MEKTKGKGEERSMVCTQVQHMIFFLLRLFPDDLCSDFELLDFTNPFPLVCTLEKGERYL
jgi:hypothetical protein